MVDKGTKQEALLSEEYDLDITDLFTRTFVCAERWMKRARAAEQTLAEVRRTLTIARRYPDYPAAHVLDSIEAAVKP